MSDEPKASTDLSNAGLNFDRPYPVAESGELDVTPTFEYQGEIMEGYKFSYSRVSTYLSCPQKHQFSYVEGLKTKAVARPLFFGGDFHKLLEVRDEPVILGKTIKGIQKAYDDLTPRQQYDLGDNYLDDLFTVFGDYVETWGNEEKPVETEREFLIQIGKYKGYPVYFHGKIDELYEDWSIGEHKTFNIMPEMSVLAMNMQSMLYAKAVEIETGVVPERIRWDYIKSSPAKKPIWLEKSGRFSEATNSGITHLSWLRACEERGESALPYRDKAEQYRQNISNFFFRCSFAIVPEMVESVWADFKALCREIVTTSSSKKIKNISRDCSWCNYRPICYAEFTGADVEQVKKTDYVAKER